ncbi:MULTISPECIES: ferric reductase-like transmembrane domain-containing protein [Anaerococcus]|uniref:Putative sulfite oxidase subunit YedZ n=1 Tax=Anaerococcus vaginalis TaxID=33037 RepID=A0A6N2TI74_9FIRM|nr:ferric reductase-like transmembrane domain-containing protein [Anaerococcus vaginalis]MDU1706929.1 ferric reductase-like transmembrane domain-containing protein [Anaerococcus vaginalis]MDU1762799.1 ferric reductase-like transmembrane domain-containing protein [Anaerococcus vaginalis]MDU2648361.1 ferric reductase-like transmembrane domain-containing protein [Anaerococcus vaginalis]MDU5373451.1 ferric reductase-like transmembrane domain-containing protein [Anaerococcus vaginalis]MDU7650528.1 
MTLITGILFTIIFYSLTKDLIKKYPVIFYLGIYAWTGFVVYYYNMGFDRNFPTWFNEYFMKIFSRGIFATASFMIVMFLGTITKHNDFSKKLMAIRGEMSIMASLLVFSHNIIFGLRYFPILFTNPSSMPQRQLIASIITIFLLLMLIPLFVTSFKTVRRKMKAKSWKNLQKMAYPFFIGIYIHVMVLYSSNWKENMVGVVIYTLIYLAYIILRLRKRNIKMQKSLAK